MALDLLGQEINEGDYVVYPGRSGSSLWINISRVVSIERKTTRWGFKVETFDVLKVINAKRQPRGKVKIVTVQCLDRVLKLGPIAVANAIDNRIIEDEDENI